MSGNDKVRPAATAEVVCEDGLCSVARPLGGAALPSRKLGIAAVERQGASLHPESATKSGSSAPAKRSFLVDLLHGDVDLERFFKDE
ncbi:MAG: hypothetical protein C0464_04015 [Cyanobacteria bacterium DS2.008]|jgi:hypothetical protein|nr:hypothetical protein [Cyanobacteria bacterium DS2.008]